MEKSFKIFYIEITFPQGGDGYSYSIVPADFYREENEYNANEYDTIEAAESRLEYLHSMDFIGSNETYTILPVYKKS